MIRSPAPDPSLVLDLPLWKRDGTTILSDDVYGRQCTVTGAGFTGYGRSFNGVDQKVSVPSGTQLAVVTDMTVLIWAKVAALAAVGGWDAQYACLARAANDAIALYAYNTGNINALDSHLIVGNVYSGPTGLKVISMGSFYFVGWVHRGLTNQFYHNGQPDNTLQTQVAATKTAGGNVDIGRTPGNQAELNGVVGWVRVFNRALFPLEIDREWLQSKWRFQ